MCRIVNADGVEEAMREEDGFVIRDGVVVIIKDAQIAVRKEMQAGVV